MLPGRKPRYGQRARRAGPLTRGLVGAYAMNEPDGLVLMDGSPEQHHMTLLSAHSIARTQYGQARTFATGANSGATTPYDARLSMTAGFTASGRFAYNFSGGNRSIVGRPANSADSAPFLDWHVYISSNQFAVGINGNFVGTGIAGVSAIDGAGSMDAPFYHFVVRADGARLMVWIDGTRVYDAANTNLPVNTSSQPPTLGRYSPATSQNFDGWIEHICVWNQPLSLGEIERLVIDPYAVWSPVSEPLDLYSVAAAGGEAAGAPSSAPTFEGGATGASLAAGAPSAAPAFDGAATGAALKAGDPSCAPTFAADATSSAGSAPECSPTFTGGATGASLAAAVPSSAPTFDGAATGIALFVGVPSSAPTFTGGATGASLAASAPSSAPTFSADAGGAVGPRPECSPTFNGAATGASLVAGVPSCAPSFNGAAVGGTSEGGTGEDEWHPDFYHQGWIPDFYSEPT